MSKRKPKRSRRLKVVARAQQNKQPLVRSPRVRSLRTASAGSTPPIDVRDDLKQETRIDDNRARVDALEAVVQTSLQNDLRPKTKEAFELSLSLASMQAYQAKLLEVTQANVQFAFEFMQRLATTKSPFEFLAAIAEFTGRRVAMDGQHSTELAALWGVDVPRELAV